MIRSSREILNSSTSFFVAGRSKKSAGVRNIFFSTFSLFCGLGNIYASEVLYRCGINPCRKAKNIKLKEWELIVDQTRKVLNEAIEKNGTSISDFRKVDEKTGEFQNFLRVYECEGKPCISCGMLIQRIVQQQRSSYFCPGCQV